MTNGESNEYEWVTIHEVKCIVWSFTSMAGDNTEKKQRKQLKDRLGLEHQNVPMLDTKGVGLDREYCDIIVHSDSITAWEATIRDYYSTYDMPMKIIPGGHQVSFCNQEDVFVSVNFYPGTNKFMVQPGKQQEENLLKWIKAFATLADNFSKSNKSEPLRNMPEQGENVTPSPQEQHVKKGTVKTVVGKN
jgi:hypothetical protein